MTDRRNGLKFGTLEVGRALAASLVVFHHAGNIAAQPRFYGEQAFSGHLQNFNVGVDFFFVLSGFIITWVHWSDIGDASRLGRYAIKRFLRIYPPYWGIMIPLALLYLLSPATGVPSQRDPLNIILSIFLLPAPAQPVLGVAWTLVHEVFFYALFALVILIGRAAFAIFPIWALAILAVDRWGGSAFPLSFFASPFNLEFIMGVFVAALLKSCRIPHPWLFATVGTASFLSLMLFAVHIQDDPLIGRLAFGSSALLAILGLVEAERRRPIPLASALAVFGAASYAIYLIHPVALSFAVHFLRAAAGSTLPLTAIVLLLAAAGIAAGLAFHRFAEPAFTKAVEQSILRLTRRHQTIRIRQI